METQAQISCPNCGTPIDVNKVLFEKVRTEIGQDFESKLAKERETLATERKKVEAAQKEVEAQVAAAVEQQVTKAKKEQEAAIRKKLSEEQAEALKTLQDELKEKSNQLKELNKTRAELAKAQREKDELADKIKAEAEVQLNARLTKEKVVIAKAEADKQELKLKEKDEVIAKITAELAETQRRAQQGSMQSQGEVQELAIEEWLRSAFPLDTVEEISKGVRGGDCIHRVFDRTGHELGSVYYESKRTKHFTEGWIAKLKQDMQAARTHVGVIVTEAMPADMDRMGQCDGIWVCTYEEFKSLCYVLREMMLQVGQAISSQANKGDKMELLYNYLTGSEFRMHIEAIVQSFSKMKGDIAAERRSYERIWNEREKNLDLVMKNTAQMFGSIKGIAGAAIAPVQSLELPEGGLNTH
jgi:hypothetical protein